MIIRWMASAFAFGILGGKWQTQNENHSSNCMLMKNSPHILWMVKV